MKRKGGMYAGVNIPIRVLDVCIALGLLAITVLIIVGAVIA